MGIMGMGNDELDREESALGINLSDSSAVRTALLFGSAAVAFALILTPFLNWGAEKAAVQQVAAQRLDYTTTGSVGQTRQYTLRRSVLQSSPGSVCVINKSGGQTGEC
jgi:hypothetical protein